MTESGGDTVAVSAGADGKTVLSVYIRQGCHLCDEMIDVLSEFRNDYNFSIRMIDIDADASLRDKYNIRVPVLCHGDREICHHFFDLNAFRQAMANS